MNDTPAIDLKDVTLQSAAFSLEGRITVHYAAPGIVAPTEAHGKASASGTRASPRIAWSPPPRSPRKFRSFYSKMENKDQESVVLTTAPVTASAKQTGN
jgi:hypothetical protein